MATKQHHHSDAGGGGAVTLLWRPYSVEGHHLELVRADVNRIFGLNLADYFELHRWSVENPDKFWGFMWDYLGFKASVGVDAPVGDRGPEVIDVAVPMDSLPPLWFPRVRMNYAENLLRHPDDGKVALYYTNETMMGGRDSERVRSMTFGELKASVTRVASALEALGVRTGDRVVGYLPNCPETLILMAAASSLGAVWSSTSPDFGVSGVLDRFQQIRPKVIFSVESVAYNLKVHDHLAKLRAVAAGLGSLLETVVVIPFVRQEQDVQLEGREIFWSAFLEKGRDGAARFEQLPFGHPLFIMYSSGTTGKPKCIVHGQGGTLMKHLEEHRVQGNRTESDVLMYYTTVGWMMWNWLVSALALGTTLVLYDGSPFHPTPAVLWDLVDEVGITVLGVSAKWLAVQEDRGVKPAETHRLHTLKALLSTGSPLKPSSYDYVYRDVKTVLLASISGGTDICACFVGENSTLPVHRGQVQSAHLGCRIEAWDNDGDGEAAGPVPDGVPGEMVCTKPFPSMPVGFWNDMAAAEGVVDQEQHHPQYRAAYFAKYQGVWAHGDFICMDPDTKGLVMLGRSDGTLNPNGVRFGSADIYNIVESEFRREVEDSLCVGQKSPADGEERVILFLKMRPEVKFDDDLVLRMKATIRERLSVRHVPALFLPIKDIPYTVNGKKVEVAVKYILAGMPVKNQSALANPESLDLYKSIPETKNWKG